MSRTFKIAGISGSLRKESVNKKLILRAQQLCSEQLKEATINVIDWSQLPLYNQVFIYFNIILFHIKKKYLKN
jgi:chromate reductase